MDVVYILGDGSVCGDEEIKYSVRSLVTHMVDLRNVYVVGAEPRTLPNAIHIQAADESNKFWLNAYKKTLRACEIEELSEQFILMNDDFFAVADFLGAELPYFAHKKMSGGNSGPIAFQVHMPIRFEKELYKKMPFPADMNGHFSPRSFYGNIFQCPPTYTEDCIVRVGERMPSIESQVAKREFVSVGNGHMLYPEFRAWLDSRFPTASRFE